MQQVMGRWPYLQASVLRRRARWARGMPQRGRSAEGDMCSRRRWRAPSVHAQRRAEHPAEAAWWSAQDMPEYYTFGDAWTATYGCFVAQGRGRTVWLDERPARWGGQWALGCSACAHFERQRASTSSEQRASTPCAKTPVPRRQSRGVRGCTKFARYEACHASMAASHARDHAQSKIHKLAVAAHLQPDRPARILRQTTGDDERLLAGSVPQPADWHGPCVLGHCSAPGRR